MHQPIPEQGRWLAQVVRGYFAYHAVPTNRASISAFHRYVVRASGYRTLRRRSQKDRFTVGTDGRRLAADWLPQPHNSSSVATTCDLPSNTRGKNRVPEFRSHGSVRGAVE